MTFYRYFHISFAVFDVVSNAFCCISVFFLSSSGPASDYFVPFLWTFYSTCCIGSHRKLTPLKLTVCLCYVVLLGVDIFSHGLVVPPSLNLCECQPCVQHPICLQSTDLPTPLAFLKAWVTVIIPFNLMFYYKVHSMISWCVAKELKHVKGAVVEVWT